MKIDSYIRHLELQCKGLRKRQNQLSSEEDRDFYNKGRERNFDKIEEIRNKLHKANEKINFLKNLKEELIKSEMQDQKNKQR